MNLNLIEKVFTVKVSTGPFWGLMGSAMFSDSKYFSKARGTATNAVRLSHIFFSFERMFGDEIAAVENAENDVVVLRYKDSSSETVYASFDGKTIRSTEEMSTSGICSLYVAWATMSHKASEAKELFVNARNEYNSGVTEAVTGVKCIDAFYYEDLKPNKERYSKLDYQPEGLTVSSAKMAFESAAYVSHPLFGVEGKGEAETEEGTAEAADDIQVFYEKCLCGDFLVSFDFGEEAEPYIPSLSSLDDFAPTEEFCSIVSDYHAALSKIILMNDTGSLNLVEALEELPNIILAGVPGTGKTRILYAVGAALGIPVYSIPVQARTEADTFQGMTVIDGDGKLCNIQTDFLKGFVGGGLVIVEEANLLDPNLSQGVLGQAIEAPYIIMKDGHERITRNPMCVIAFTMNPQTIGTTSLNQAFASRSQAVFFIGNPDKDKFVANMKAKYSDRWSDAQYGWAYTIMNSVQSYLNSAEVNAGDIAEAITPRLAMGLLKQMEKRPNVEANLQKTFIGMIRLYDESIADETMEFLSSTVKTKYPR